MKIRTVEDLDQEIDAEISWRKQELGTALKLVRSGSGPMLKANLRSGVVILYAHWEGWIKTVARLYIRYVNTQSVPCDSLSEAFLGNALKSKMDVMTGSKVSSVHNKFAAFIRTELTNKAVLSEELVRTESNLTSGVLLDIIDRIGLERRPLYALRANMIDVELVHRRNTIAHGQYLDLTPEEFRELRANVIDLLELFTDDVRNAASTGKYLACPVPQT